MDLVEACDDFAIHREALLGDVSTCEGLRGLRLEPGGEEGDAIEEVFEIGRREF